MAETASTDVNCGPGIYCVRCGYDLRVTSKGGICPECRETCEASLWIRTEAGQRWRRRMRCGALWLAGAAALLLLYDWLLEAYYQFGYRFGYQLWFDMLVGPQWWLVALTVGAFLITARFAPDRRRRWWMTPIRLLAPWLLLLWTVRDTVEPLLNSFSRFFSPFSEQSDWLLNTFRACFQFIERIYWPVWIGGLLLLLVHIFLIASRLRTRRLLVQMRIAAVALAIWAMLYYNLNDVGYVVRSWGTYTLIVAWNNVESFLNASALWIESLLQIWAVFVMLWLARMYSTPLPEQPVEPDQGDVVS